ncbi:MAG: hypothetical protein U1E17_04125 [Geminicoccaceae bacterium]
MLDTTAAGDSFAAGYLAARRAGRDPAAAARPGPPARRCRGAPSRCDHPARGHAGARAGGHRRLSGKPAPRAARPAKALTLPCCW